MNNDKILSIVIMANKKYTRKHTCKYTWKNKWKYKWKYTWKYLKMFLPGLREPLDCAFPGTG